LEAASNGSYGPTIWRRWTYQSQPLAQQHIGVPMHQWVILHPSAYNHEKSWRELWRTHLRAIRYLMLRINWLRTPNKRVAGDEMWDYSLAPRLHTLTIIKRHHQFPQDTIWAAREVFEHATLRAAHD
jgi:hypothetical protein